MDAEPRGETLISSEAHGLAVRLDQLEPFVMRETMVPAAALPPDAQWLIERFLYTGREELRRSLGAYRRWLAGPGQASLAEQQRRFVILRLQFNVVLAQFDLFTEVVTQRSEHGTGIWLSGLDVLARDALAVPGIPDDGIRIIVYLARGAGAAIRRAHTRLPGGRPNPVGILRLPRERMVGSGIASSLIHEVGHQGAAQLDLLRSLKAELGRRHEQDPRGGWDIWSLWISEIVADLWSVGTVGITSTVGLLAVVSLPRFFVFRLPDTDPHPMPYLRVLISAAIGKALYPHPQWDELAATWRSMYPTDQLPGEHRTWIATCESRVADFVDMVLHHRPPSLGGREIGEIWPLDQRQPARLLALHRAWKGDLGLMARQPPSLVFAVLGQAKAAGVISAATESAELSRLLTAWAVRSTLDPTRYPIARPLPARTVPRPIDTIRR